MVPLSLDRGGRRGGLIGSAQGGGAGILDVPNQCFRAPGVADVDLVDPSVGPNHDGSQIVIPVDHGNLGSTKGEPELFGDRVDVDDFPGGEAPSFGIIGVCRCVLFQALRSIMGGIEGEGEEVPVFRSLLILIQGLEGGSKMEGHARAKIGERASCVNEGDDQYLPTEGVQVEVLPVLIHEGVVWEGISGREGLHIPHLPEGGKRGYLARCEARLSRLEVVDPALGVGDVERETDRIAHLESGELVPGLDRKGHGHRVHVIRDLLMLDSKTGSRFRDFLDHAADLEGSLTLGTRLGGWLQIRGGFAGVRGCILARGGGGAATGDSQESGEPEGCDGDSKHN